MTAYRRVYDCRLTVKNRDQLRNHTLGNRVWATFTLFYHGITVKTVPRIPRCPVIVQLSAVGTGVLYGPQVAEGKESTAARLLAADGRRSNEITKCTVVCNVQKGKRFPILVTERWARS